MSTQAPKLATRNPQLATHKNRQAPAASGVRSIKKRVILQNKPNLPNTQINLTSVITKDYQNTHLLEHPKTNPIQSQYKANTNPIPEKPKMNVTSILTKDYENETAFRPQKNKPNSNPIKPNLW